MTIINASLPLLVGQAAVVQHTSAAAQAAPEAQQQAAQAQSMDELIKSREQIQVTEAQSPTSGVNPDGANNPDQEAGPRDERRRHAENDEAPQPHAISGQLIDLDI